MYSLVLEFDGENWFFRVCVCVCVCVVYTHKTKKPSDDTNFNSFAICCIVIFGHDFGVVFVLIYEFMSGETRVVVAASRISIMYYIDRSIVYFGRFFFK